MPVLNMEPFDDPDWNLAKVEEPAFHGRCPNCDDAMFRIWPVRKEPGTQLWWCFAGSWLTWAD